MRHKNRFQILYGYIYGEKVKRTLIKYVYNWDETQTKISNIIWIYIWGKGYTNTNKICLHSHIKIKIV